MKKHVVLVAGYEYFSGRTDFAIVAKCRANYLVHINTEWRNDPELVFTLFDVRRGTIEEGTSSNGLIDWKVVDDSFDAINPAIHYNQETDFIEQETKVISIMDVYKWIQKIGASNRRSVYELSIISHGWRKGPLLVNSYERNVYSTSGSKSKERDPWDKDGRQKDTNIENMELSKWINFINAFNETGIVWVWGCAASQLYKSVIRKVLKSPEFKTKKYGTHIDSDLCTLSFTQDFANNYFAYDTLFFFRSATVQTIKELRFSRTMKEIKDFLIRAVVQTYAGQMAFNTGLTIYAAVPGTGADYEREVDHKRKIMVIPRNEDIYGYSFKSVVQFYKTYLTILEDPEGRGYVYFDSNKIAKWKNRVI